MKKLVKSAEGHEKRFVVYYISKDDRSCQDIVYALDSKDAERQVKKRGAYRILNIVECK